MIRLICATRCSEGRFFTDTILGRSLNFFRQYSNRFELRLFPENTEGLSTVYNRAIAESLETSRILAFIHDDIHFLDLFWPDAIEAGLQQFDLIGTLGCKRHYPQQLSWVHVVQDGKVVNPKREDVTGAVAHFEARGSAERQTSPELRPDRLAPFDANIYLSYFSSPGQQVVFLDGMLLVCKSETLSTHQLFFDERFDFHFYDMDFCRQFEQKGLRMGTWPISVLHGSHGSYGQNFLDAYPGYVAKWRVPK